MDPYWLEGIVVLLLAVAVLMTPVVRFMQSGWQAKRRDILDGLDELACRAYFEMFCRNGELPALGQARTKFIELYDHWYGIRRFLVPAIELFLVTVVAVASVVATMIVKSGGSPTPLIALDVTGVAAVTGAYMWVCHDLISRNRRLDLTPSDLQWCSMRFLICIPMGYAIGRLAADSLGPFLAFGLGALPIEGITSVLRRVTYQTLKIEERNEEVADSVVRLQGTDRAIVERLANEDIHTIVQLAYCDPVHTTMRSNLHFNLVTDLMGQSLLRLYLRDDAEKLAPYGLRGAVEIRHLVCELDGSRRYDAPDDQQSSSALEILNHAAKAVAIAPEALLFTFRQVAEDPYTRFLFEIWTDPRRQGQDEHFSAAESLHAVG